MTGNWASLAPAIALLALLGLLAWGVQWLRRRMQATGGDTAALRVVSQLMVGPQQRVVVVELDGPAGVVQLTLGVTPQHVRTLHVQPLGAASRRTTTATAAPVAPRYADVARSLAVDSERREPTA
ncbi:MAG: FliO/MopB family protein [Tepidimonas sp.]|uniref:FliO/MopB family protein n=1 Tax=Tepidimonas sp. TaxID=2002775 RepID=UPI004054CC88